MKFEHADIIYMFTLGYSISKIHYPSFTTFYEHSKGKTMLILMKTN